MKTRATKSSGKSTNNSTESAKSVGPKVQLGPDSNNSLHLLILPEEISNEARIVSLQNPRFSTESRYVVCPQLGFYEIKAFTEPKATPRSWLLSQDVAQDGVVGSSEAQREINKSTEPIGYVSRNANLCVATPIDPLFLLLTVLAPLPTSKNSESSKKLFLSGDDYLEKLSSTSPQFRAILRTESIKSALEKRMAAVCDTVDAGDEIMYRLNEEKLVDEMLRKAIRMTTEGLPASVEEKLIRKALDMPILGISREESLLNGDLEVTTPGELGSQTPASDTLDTQITISSIDTATNSFSEASTAANSLAEESMAPPPDNKLLPRPAIKSLAGVAELLRIRTALFFICSSYVAPHVSDSIKKLLASATTVDFTPLDAHLAHLAKMRQEIVSMRSIGDFSRKRSMVEDEDSESRAEKKRKKDEEEKRKKAGESRGVKNLKKVNVTGMKKMSEFFKKK